MIFCNRSIYRIN